MTEKRVICLGMTPASAHAADYLRKAGWQVMTSADWSSRFLLLDVPSFGPGRIANPDTLMASLSRDTVIFGGRLDHPAVEEFRTVDFLKDPYYLAENARITADCAIQTAHSILKSTWEKLPVLVMGWGRIGKCLAKMLKALGARVTICARKEADLAILAALGYGTLHSSRLPDGIGSYRLIFNTVPKIVITEDILQRCENCIKIDLASCDGIEGGDVIRARGLPGILAPDSSGKLIADTFLRLVKEETV